MNDLEQYFSGEKLYGDDFTLSEIEDWYNDEKEGYANLGAKEKTAYTYGYHSLNMQNGFKYIKGRIFKNVMGMGSAYGDEFLPIANQITKLTIVDPSDSFVVDSVHGIPCTYVKPSIDGLLAFDDNSFDLVSCLGVLHHIPNVTTVVNEFYRCMSKGGVFLLREPICSMGDWSKPRAGLTKRERGIPLDILEKILTDAGFKVEKKIYCIFPIVPKFYNKLGMAAYNSNIGTFIDRHLSRLFKYNLRYHVRKFSDKFRPTSIYFVLIK